LEGALSLLRALTTTSAPARAKSFAIARPMPRLAPVTTATWPSSGFCSLGMAMRMIQDAARRV
jgi:hypothetical protein